MAAVAKYGTPTIVTKLPDGNDRVGSGYIVGSDITAGDACCLVPNTSAIAAGVPAMEVVPANGAADNGAAIVIGFAAMNAKAAQSDAVTLFRNLDWNYGTGFIAAFLSAASGPVYVYLSATVPGGLDTTPPWSGAQPIGVILDDNRIRLWGNVGHN